MWFFYCLFNGFKISLAIFSVVSPNFSFKVATETFLVNSFSAPKFKTTFQCFARCLETLSPNPPSRTPSSMVTKTEWSIERFLSMSVSKMFE